MAISLLGFGQKGPKIGPIQITCSVEERHRKTASVTDFPIENGSNVSDHIRVNQDILHLHGIISDAATSVVQAGAQFSVAADNVATYVAGKVAPSVKIPQGGIGITLPDTPQEAYTKLEELFTGGAVFKVITGLKVYENMAFTSLEVKRDKSTGKVIDFDATMQALQFVSSVRVPIAAKQTAPKTVASTRAQTTPSTVASPTPTQAPAAVQTGARALARAILGYIPGVQGTPLQSVAQ